MYDLVYVDSLKILKKGNVPPAWPEVQWEVNAFGQVLTDISLTFLHFAFWHKYFHICEQHALTFVKKKEKG